MRARLSSAFSALKLLLLFRDDLVFDLRVGGCGTTFFFVKSVFFA